VIVVSPWVRPAAEKAKQRNIVGEFIDAGHVIEDMPELRSGARLPAADSIARSGGVLRISHIILSRLWQCCSIVIARAR